MTHIITTYYHNSHSRSLNYLLRFALLAVMIVVGAVQSWGQSTGLYYIANNNDKSPYYNSSTPSTNFYLVPASDGGEENININTWAWNNNSATPFVTTYKTNQDNNSKWVVKVSETSGEYYIIHVLSGKYITLNPGVGSNSHRRTFHLETTSSPGDAHLFNFTTHTGSPSFYSIKPKTLSSGYRFLNPSKANQEKYYGTTVESGYAVGGLIGTYNKNASEDYGSKWFLETASPLAAPTISNVNAYSKVTVSENNGLPSGYNVRYTFGDGTQADPTATSPIMSADGFTVEESGTLKVVIERYGVVLTSVAAKAVVPAPCITPVISYNTENGISITTETEDASIYYTVDGTTPTSSGTLYVESFTVPDLTTIKAIAIKANHDDSEIASSTFVLSPTVNLTLPDGGYTYDGSAKEPAISSVEVSGTPIGASEYSVSYSNNINAGTATVTITDNAGGDYIVYGSTIFTIEPATLSITADAMTKGYGDPDPELTFTPTGIVAGDDVADVFTGTLTRVAGENVGTYAIGRGTLDISADNHNYEIGTFTPANLTIAEKNIGNGTTPATGITADVTRNNDGTFAVTVRHGGNKLTAGTEGTEYDYSLTQNDTDPKYHVITVTGANNYTGSFVARYANVTFGKRTGETSAGGVATFVTNSSGDFDFATPANMTAYIVTAIDTEAGTVTAEALDYIPENVPVLLLSTVDAKGFQVKARSGGVNITPEQETANMLKKADVDKVLTTAQVYLLYKGEFVLNAAGTLPAGKVYLSKDGVALAPPVLDILWGTETGIEELTINKEQLTTDNGQLAIYDLQGRCVKTIDKTQLPKGIYIVNGRKVVVR